MKEQRRQRRGGAPTRLSPRTAVETLWQQAILAHRGGKLNDAEALYRRVLAVVRDHAGCHNNLGLIGRARGDLSAAEAAFRMALAVDPGFAEAHYNLGNTQHDLGRPALAIASYRAAIRCRPSYRDARFNLGNRLGETGDGAAAILAHGGALALDPDHPGALNHLGNIALGQGRAVDALAWYERACDLRPYDPLQHCNRAGAYDRLNKPGRALAAALHAVALDPRMAEIHFSIGTAHKKLNDVVASIHALNRTLDLNPAHIRARAQLLHQLQLACAWDKASELAAVVDQETANQLAAGHKTTESPTAICMRLDDPSRQRQVAESWAGDVARRVRALTPIESDRAGGRTRLRIGYLSCSFLDHPTGHNMSIVLPAHDTGRFEIFAYSYGPDDGSTVRQAIARHTHAFIDLAELNDRTAAERIRADGIDILVDLNVWIDQARPAIAAHRPAPINAAWHTPSTSGATYFDYAIVDPIAVPPADVEAWRESLVFLPHCYAPCPPKRNAVDPAPARASQGLPEDALVFASFNTTYKIDQAIWQAWMDILDALPGAVLWLSHANAVARDNLTRATVRHGVGPERLVFAPRADSVEAHLDRLCLSDLGLDTALYNGHTTTFDMLRAGVPVLTTPGRGFAARVAASILTNAGFDDLVAPNPRAYIDRAIALARDPPTLAALRRRIFDAHKTAPLFDIPRFVRDLERAYETIWARYKSGLPPTSITL